MPVGILPPPSASGGRERGKSGSAVVRCLGRAVLGVLGRFLAVDSGALTVEGSPAHGRGYAMDGDSGDAGGAGVGAGRRRGGPPT